MIQKLLRVLRGIAVVLLALVVSVACGVLVRFVLEAVLRSRRSPAVVADRVGWLVLVSGVIVGAVVIFAVIARAPRAAAVLAGFLALLAGFAWNWQPAGVGFLVTSLCVVLATAGAAASSRVGALLTALGFTALAVLYGRAANPPDAEHVETAIVVLVPVAVLAVHLLPASDRGSLRWVAVSAVPFLMAAGIAGYYFRDSGRVSDHIPKGGRPESPPAQLGGLDNMIFDYSPVLVFTRRELWRPVIASTYLITGRGRDIRTGKRVPLIARYRPERYDLRGCSADKPCYEITSPCYPTPPPGMRDDCQDRGIAGPQRYDLFRRPMSRQTHPRHFAGQLPYPDLQYVLQYWMFYPYDVWRSSEGLIKQQHGGDWEAITIGLSRKAPLFVAYSAHCGGVWRDWKDVHAVGHDPKTGAVDFSRPGTNVVAWVAEGSHAMYPTDGDAVPDWSGCADTFKGKPVLNWLARVGLSGSARETISHDLGATARDGSLQPATRYQILMFPGQWGHKDQTTLAGLTVDEGHGPESPPCQGLWIDPIWTIFCSPHWEGPDDRCPKRRLLTKPNPCNGSFPTGPDTPEF
jgi:hypothetical protein